MAIYKTKNKEKVLDILKNNNKKLLSIKQIEKKAKDVPISTIYRIINNLEKDNKLSVNIRENGEKEYQLLTDTCEDHIHIKCSNCGKMNHIFCRDISLIKNHLKKEHGFIVDTIKTISVGLCQKCSNKLNEKEDKNK